MERHVEFLERAPRDPGSEHLRASRDYCADRLEALGYRVERQSVAGDTGENVIGTRKGSEKSNERILVSAHIDSVPNCRGADDNASGVAGALEVARLLAQRSYARTLVVACWDLEEVGLVGSAAYAQAAKQAGDEILVSVVFEMIGYTTSVPGTQKLPVAEQFEPTFRAAFPEAYEKYVGDARRGEFIAVIADAAGAYNDAGAGRFVQAFERASNDMRLETITLELTREQIALLPDTERSDHAAFWRAGYSAVQLTDTAELRNPNYHCRRGVDTVTTLDFAFAAQTTQATAEAVAALLE